jgi:hypothetical protein
MLRTSYPAQALAIMGVSRRWQLARNANVVVTFSKSWPGRPYFGLTGPGHFLVRITRHCSSHPPRLHELAEFISLPDGSAELQHCLVDDRTE